ncbi:MAG: HAMP domain-containing histidine kinase [Anaerolineae bacterium]|nr:HAMP domain-containing histidine kinase [Anaerolineae bacterium]
MRLDTLPLESIPLEPELDNLRVFRLVEPPQGSESLAACFSEAALPRPDMMLRVFNALGLCLILLDEHNAIQDMNKQARAILSHAKLGDDIVTLLPEIQETLSTLRKDALESFSLTAGGYDFEGCALRWQGVAGWQTLLICLEPPAAYTDEFTRVGLLRMLIHDLSNPLYIALNFGRLLQDNIIAGEEATQATDIIVNNLQRMQDLLADLSSLEQLGENISSSFESVEIATIAATVVANLDERAHSQQIRLLLNPLPDDGCHIHGNERLLRQALHNLVENAIKYTLPGGWVRVTVRPTGQHYEILVADNGIGIAPAKHRQLFTPFFRVKDPRMPEVNGTGLGLSLVRMVAAQHRGQVRLHSIPEKGTIFVMQLPRSGARQQQLQQYLQR